jgi:hypothetical protein
MPARREQTHDHFGRSPGRWQIADRPRASALAGRGLAAIAARWAAAGLLLVASFWAYLGAAELAGGTVPGASHRRDAPEAQGPGCTVLTLNRSSGHTTAGPCLGPAQILRDTLTARLSGPAAH